MFAFGYHINMQYAGSPQNPALFGLIVTMK